MELRQAGLFGKKGLIKDISTLTFYLICSIYLKFRDTWFFVNYRRFCDWDLSRIHNNARDKTYFVSDINS